MSKTYRKQKGNRPWRRHGALDEYINRMDYGLRNRYDEDPERYANWINTEDEYDSWCLVEETDHNYKESAAVKWYTRKARRSHWQQQQARFWKDPENNWDFYDKAKKYIGFWWYYD